ncbi:helix-turn-helix domain-containing protein [Micromonospora maritima]|uniref:helix-turn-helix domain-containing protein n=1 Tax=Micromonospora maritima TaxID=986711 RepID=UPI00157C1709|nr:helix-turn-helix domain-containing protein [Micromonospora maritima]
MVSAAGGPPAVVESYVLRLGGGKVLLSSPQACLDVLRALQAAVAAAHRTGLRPPPRVVGLIATLEAELADYRAAASTSGNAELPRDLNVPRSVQPTEPADTKEAARMLGVTDRQVRNLGDRLDGRKVGRTWVFDRDLVAAEAARRQREGAAS